MNGMLRRCDEQSCNRQLQLLASVICPAIAESIARWAGLEPGLTWSPKKMGQELCKQLNPQSGGEIICKLVSELWKSLEGERRESPKGER